MRPIKVTMQAFGPYIDKTVCDFTKLSDNSLFLITGPTGSGKTTILDAMSFALYGYATGLMRTFKDMRNTAAPDSLGTYTEFEFELGGKAYKFIRTADVHKKRSGEKEDRFDAECYVQNGDEWQLIDTGNKKVSQRAAELLGFTHSQFSQVIVLPQGEFRKLLLASSKEKAEILQTLFATERWQLIIDAAVRKSRSLKEEYDELSGRFSALLESAGASSEEELVRLHEEAEEKAALLSGEAEKCAAEADRARIKYEQAKTTVQKFDSLRVLTQQLDELNGQTEEINALQARLALYDKILVARPFLVAYKNARESAQATDSRLKESQKRAAEAVRLYERHSQRAKGLDEQKERRRALELEAERLKALLPDAAEYSSAFKRSAEQQTLLSALKAEKTALESELETLDTRIRKNQEYIEQSYKKYIEDYPSYLKEFSLLKDAADKRQELAAAETRLKTAESELKNSGAGLSEAGQRLKAAEEAYGRAERLLMENAAYSLASSLSDNTPCPVCGSVHHPALAKAPNGAVDRQQLDHLKSAVDAARAEYNQSAADTAKLEAEYRAAKESVGKASDALKGVLPADDGRLSELERLIEESTKYKEVYKRQSAALEKLRAEYSAKRSEGDSLSSKYAKESASAAALTAKCEELKRRLPQDVDDAAINERIKSLQDEIGKISSELDELQRALDASREAVHKSNAECETLAKTLEENKKAATDASLKFTEKCAALEISESDASMPLPTESETAAQKSRVEEHKNSMALLSHRLSDLRSELKDTQPPDLAAAEEELADKRAKESAAAEQVGSMRQRLENINTARRRLAELAGQNERIAAKIDRYTRISDMLMGRNLHRTTLQGFVLGLMLDEVVLAACRYLNRLSRGRFALVRVDTEGGTAQHGLDIEVMDAYLGSQRKICTLSGGELFLASLSLAFGLAEVVQNYSGGIRFDSLFIDEGFGSLDAATLNLAMDAFDEIRRDGRMVGIISHVEELRERIGARIEIISSSDGSHIRISN